MTLRALRLVNNYWRVERDGKYFGAIRLNDFGLFVVVRNGVIVGECETFDDAMAELGEQE